ncbi:MAG: hypothetical protein JSW51_05390 [Gemmatimonadota bacterium]|nr:MAG: hypothetical protein JSW51_05390 [Gemmatimonadota bacterium]
MTDFYEYQLPTWAAVYFVNGDRDTLTDAEVELADEWYDKAVGENAVLDVPVQEPYFAYSNCVDSLGSDVYDVRVYVLGGK